MRGFLMGGLALIVLEVLVSSSRASGAVGGIFGLAATAAERFIDPAVPAIGPRPDKSASAGAASIPNSTALALIPGAGGGGAPRLAL